jgi:hypothetical protein
MTAKDQDLRSPRAVRQSLPSKDCEQASLKAFTKQRLVTTEDYQHASSLLFVIPFYLQTV